MTLFFVGRLCIRNKCFGNESMYGKKKLHIFDVYKRVKYDLTQKSRFIQLVYAKCLLSIYLDSSNSRETRCVSWVLSTSVCSTGSFSAHTATYSTSENAHETHRVSLKLRNLNTHLIQTSCNICELPPYVIYCIYLNFEGKGWRMIWRHREKIVH